MRKGRAKMGPMTRTLWLDRVFAFDIPVGEHPALLERLRSLPGRLEQALSGLPPGVLTRRVDGKWSMQENAGHLLDLESLMLTRLDDFLAGREVLTPADVTNPATEAADHNAADLSDLLAALRRERGEMVARIEALAPEDFARTSLHPRLRKPMRLVDWMHFTAEHDDHHLGRIGELRAGLA